MLTKSTLLKFYKRKEIQQALVEHAQNKEIGMRYSEYFGKRPDILAYPRDVMELALNNLTSLHASEELWSNPLALNSSLSRKEMDELRIGWDLVLDIDCKIMEYSRISANLIIKFLKYCGVDDVSVKFSGNKGFHIGVPFEAFPKRVGNLMTKDLFPEAPRKIASYIKEHIKDELGRQILEFEGNNIGVIKDKVGLPQEDVIRYENNEYGDKVSKLSVDKFLEIDTILLASRHLYRMPYSLHEKSGLVSLPLDPNKVLDFEKPMANPENIVTSKWTFMNRNVTGESGRNLLLQAMDFEVNIDEREYENGGKKQFEEVVIESPIKEDFFPECMKKIMGGMEDGRKRSVFIMMNFLGKLGWSKRDIESFLYKWNKDKNREPLREVFIKGQMNHFTPGAKLPPNCENEGYYLNLGIKCGNCKRFKNPVNYSLWRWRRHLRDIEEGKKEKPVVEVKKEDTVEKGENLDKDRTM
jgi:hypothetical protein